MKTGFENLSNTELITAFIKTQEFASTKKTYKGVLIKFDSIVNKPFNQITKMDMVNFKEEVAGKASSTRQTNYSVIRTFFNWLVWAGVIDEEHNPARGSFKRLTPKVDLASKCLISEEVEAIKEAARPDARSYAMVAMAALTGARISELINMKWSDMFQVLDKDTQKLVWYIKVIGKGGKVRECFLTEGAVNALIKLNNGKDIDTSNTNYIFTRFYRQKYDKLTDDGARNILEGLAVKAGIKKAFTPHWFRHTFLSQSLANGANPRDVQYVAGHASLRTTEGYLWALGTKVADFYPVKF